MGDPEIKTDGDPIVDFVISHKISVISQIDVTVFCSWYKKLLAPPKFKGLFDEVEEFRIELFPALFCP